jgi:MFS family permease
LRVSAVCHQSQSRVLTAFATGVCINLQNPGVTHAGIFYAMTSDCQMSIDPSVSEELAEKTESHNILALVLHQVLFRVAWIFKTESVMMPAFLDSITSSGWVRGLLPPLNRFGQSLAPLMLSDRLSRSSLKSSWMARTTFLMSLPFLGLGGIQLLLGDSQSPWRVLFFLSAYTTFFCLHGVNQAAFNTLQGKLIRPNHRGRLMALVGYIGSPVAVLLAWLLLKRWTDVQPPLFAWIFLFTGAAFLAASLTVSRLRETPDPVVDKVAINVRRRFTDAWTALRTDRHLRRLGLFSGIFVFAQFLFPHYQRLGRMQPGYEGQMLMVWVIAQNLAAAFFSWISGRLADQRGTRCALRWLSFGAVFAPVLALALAAYGSAGWYWLTFFWLGLVPVTFRMQLNYALELTDRAQHPIYVSTVVLCMAVPIVLSPLVGECVERIGYVLPFCMIAVVLLFGWCMTLTMIEPRSQDL